jgi:hypothetical protein
MFLAVPNLASTDLLNVGNAKTHLTFILSGLTGLSMS